MLEAPPYCVGLVRSGQSGVYLTQGCRGISTLYNTAPRMPSPPSGSVGGAGALQWGEKGLVQEAVRSMHVHSPSVSLYPARPIPMGDYLSRTIEPTFLSTYKCSCKSVART